MPKTKKTTVPRKSLEPRTLMMDIAVTGLGSKESVMSDLKEILDIVWNKLRAEKIPLTSFSFDIRLKGKKLGKANVINRDLGKEIKKLEAEEEAQLAREEEARERAHQASKERFEALKKKMGWKV
jgi:hypothetical protein